MPSAVSSRRRRACSRRTRSTYRPGVMPVSDRKARVKWRGDRRARAASDSTERSASGRSVMNRWISLRGSRCAVWAASWTLNCAWFPGRRRNTTRWRAMVRAASRPRSSSTRARARSMPAVTPAEVAMGPSRTYTGSGSISAAGWSRASWSQYAQWVVARRPSSRPASASTAAPVHTETSRPAPGPCSRTQSTRRGSGAREPVPPGTRRTSGAGAVARDVSGTRVRPLVVRTGAPSREAVRIRYAPGESSSAPAKTSTGPVTSRLCTPSKRTASTVRWAMPSILRGRGVWPQ